MNEFSGNLSDFRSAVEEGLKALTEGRVVSHEEAKAKIMRACCPPPHVRVGDYVLVHGETCEVIAEDEDNQHRGFLYRNSAGEELFYSDKWPINPDPKCLWILEQ